ncbi:uncharacterized protein [Haliotis cracherodii]|uniref:uncharacterized protein n=1 Tax=Haliotis cracherodii TaxID=6455 RepID=UPI0039E864BE
MTEDKVLCTFKAVTVLCSDLCTVDCSPNQPRLIHLYLDDAVTASRLHLRQDAQHHALSLPQEHTKKRRRTSRRSKARVDKQVLMLRLPFSRLSLQPLSERSATRDTKGAATDSGQLGARSRKVHSHKDIHSDQPLDLSRKRKRSNLDTLVGDKHRRVETATPFLPGGVKKCEIVHQVETHKTGEAASTTATPGDVSRGRRRVWRRKQGNSPTKKTTDVPSSTTNRRRIQRLAESPLDL